MSLAPHDAWRLDVSSDYTRDRSLRSTLEANSSTLGAGTADAFAPQPFVLDENDRRTREDFGARIGWQRDDGVLGSAL